MASNYQDLSLTPCETDETTQIDEAEKPLFRRTNSDQDLTSNLLRTFATEKPPVSDAYLAHLPRTRSGTIILEDADYAPELRENRPPSYSNIELYDFSPSSSDVGSGTVASGQRKQAEESLLFSPSSASASSSSSSISSDKSPKGERSFLKISRGKSEPSNIKAKMGTDTCRTLDTTKQKSKSCTNFENLKPCSPRNAGIKRTFSLLETNAGGESLLGRDSGLGKASDTKKPRF